MTDLTCSGVSKRYLIRPEASEIQGNRVSKLRGRFSAKKEKEFWAVRGLNFEVPNGQALGVIGHNGAGKSTLLKLLSGITAPTTGEISVRGRLAALLEVGSGFHPELTGRENVFLSGSILGMTQQEIREKLERIIDFAEVRQFIDVPVKRYSSGMYVRLGFSIAAHLEPQVLLLDEVLAVGDAAFQEKCTNRILELRKTGTTIVFISHDLTAVERLCDRVLVMKQGQVVYDGDPAAAIAFYHGAAASLERTSRINPEDARVKVTDLVCLDEGGGRVLAAQTGQQLRVRIDYVCHKPVDNAQIVLYFNGSHGLQCVFSTRFSGQPPSLAAGAGYIEFRTEELALGPDVYRLDVIVAQFGATDPLEWLVGAASLHVHGGQTLDGGQFFHPQNWRMVTQDEAILSVK